MEFNKLKDDIIFMYGDDIWVEDKRKKLIEKLNKLNEKLKKSKNQEDRDKIDVLGCGVVMFDVLTSMDWLPPEEVELSEKDIEEFGFTFTDSEQNLLKNVKTGGRRKKSRRKKRRRKKRRRKKRTKRRR